MKDPSKLRNTKRVDSGTMAQLMKLEEKEKEMGEWQRSEGQRKEAFSQLRKEHLALQKKLSLEAMQPRPEEKEAEQSRLKADSAETEEQLGTGRAGYGTLTSQELGLARKESMQSQVPPHPSASLRTLDALCALPTEAPTSAPLELTVLPKPADSPFHAPRSPASGTSTAEGTLSPAVKRADELAVELRQVKEEKRFEKARAAGELAQRDGELTALKAAHEKETAALRTRLDEQEDVRARQAAEAKVKIADLQAKLVKAEDEARRCQGRPSSPNGSAASPSPAAASSALVHHPALSPELQVIVTCMTSNLNKMSQEMQRSDKEHHDLLLRMVKW
ncbi:hypothetical protein JCM10213_004857 [Rhodosporidiobolus nylandii]